MSAACSRETAGCQTLKGTEAEFNASCQGSLMWLSPPARAAIVKLSGAGRDAQTALRDALLAVPLQDHRSGRNRGWEACVHVDVCVHVRMCEWTLCWYYCSAGFHSCYCCRLVANRTSEMGSHHWAKNCCSRSRCCRLPTSGLFSFIYICLSTQTNFKIFPSVCTYLCLPESE